MRICWRTCGSDHPRMIWAQRNSLSFIISGSLTKIRSWSRMAVDQIVNLYKVAGQSRSKCRFCACVPVTRFGWKHSSSPNYLRELSYLVTLRSSLPFTWISWACFRLWWIQRYRLPITAGGGWSRGIFTRTFLTHTAH